MTGIRGLCLSRRKEQLSHLRKKFRPDGPFFFLENLSLLYSSLIQKKSLLKRQAGTSISLKDRRAAPALGSRLLRSYVPLRCGPNASGSARDMDVPAHASQINFSISSYIIKTDFTSRASLWVPRGRLFLPQGFFLHRSPAGSTIPGTPGGCL